MLQLMTIYGLTFSSVGLLTAVLVPSLQERLRDFLRNRAAQASEQLSEMFVEVPVRKIFLGYLAALLIGASVGFSVLHNLLGLLGGIVVGLVLPRLVVRFITWRRQQRFKSQLVDALLALSSSLRAGLSLLQSLEVLAEESQPPMGQEIGLAVKETRMGLALDESLKRLKKRMPLDELNLVVTAILIARETGGDVTHVFGRLIETIRERQKIRERIKTLTVIPRLQGWFMALVPFVFGTFAVRINPGYFNILMHDPMGRLVGVTALGFWGVSLLMIAWFSRPPR